MNLQSSSIVCNANEQKRGLTIWSEQHIGLPDVRGIASSVFRRAVDGRRKGNEHTNSETSTSNGNEVRRNVWAGMRQVSVKKILCLKGLPRNLMASILAHEATHAWLAFDPIKTNNLKRFSILMAFGFFKGASLGNLVNTVLYVNPSILYMAFFGSLAIFASFSAAAMFAQRRSYLYLYGIAGSIMSFLAWSSLFSFFFGLSPFMFNVHVYGGLFMFLMYVVADTQMLIEKTALGSRDVAGHALELFVDLVALFVRILIIMLQNDEKKKRKERRSDRRNY